MFIIFVYYIVHVARTHHKRELMLLLK